MNAEWKQLLEAYHQATSPQAKADIAARMAELKKQWGR